MIDSKTLAEWDSETHIERCNVDKYAARNSILIEEIRRLLTENREFRESLEQYSDMTRLEYPEDWRYMKMGGEPEISDYDLVDIGETAREVLAKFPEDK